MGEAEERSPEQVEREFLASGSDEEMEEPVSRFDLDTEEDITRPRGTRRWFLFCAVS